MLATYQEILESFSSENFLKLIYWLKITLISGNILIVIVWPFIFLMMINWYFNIDFSKKYQDLDIFMIEFETLVSIFLGVHLYNPMWIVDGRWIYMETSEPKWVNSNYINMELTYFGLEVSM